MRRMKYFFGVLISLIALPLISQNTLTVKGGLVLSNVSVNGIGDAFTPDRAFLPTYQVGVFTDIPLNHQLSFTPGLQWAEKGFMAREGFNVNLFKVPVELGLMAETRFQYVQAPLWLTYTLGENRVKAYITGGPTIGYAVDGNIQTRANFVFDFNVSRHNLNLGNDLYNRFDVGAGLGVGLDIDTGKGSIVFDASYQRSFTDILNDPLLDVRARNHGIAFNLGYKIPLH